MAPAIPDHYRSFYLTFLRFAIIMLVFGGLAGVLFQEMTKSMIYGDEAPNVPPGVRLESVYHLALLHGHGFLIGAIMPICWITALQIALRLGCDPLSRKALRWIKWTYLPGAVSVLALIAYKGVVYVDRVKAGDRDFAAIHASLFGGNKLARGLAYGLSHTVATVGLIIFGWLLWRSLKKAGRHA